jgi:YesN/AraC family two-component response regulator
LTFTPAPKASITMLLVEDEDLTLGLLASVLARKYPDVVLHTAANGRLGLELFEEATSDIVITDVKMPEMDGIQMAKRIRAVRPETKIIIITGDAGRLVLNDSVEKGFEFDCQIMKPVGFQELFDAVDRCICQIAQYTR